MKKTLVTLVIIIIGVIIVVIGYSLYNNHQKRVSTCKEHCDYYSVTKFWGYSEKSTFIPLPSKNFETQEQCIDYCLNK